MAEAGLVYHPLVLHAQRNRGKVILFSFAFSNMGITNERIFILLLPTSSTFFFLMRKQDRTESLKFCVPEISLG